MFCTVSNSSNFSKPDPPITANIVKFLLLNKKYMSQEKDCSNCNPDKYNTIFTSSYCSTLCDCPCHTKDQPDCGGLDHEKENEFLRMTVS